MSGKSHDFERIGGHGKKPSGDVTELVRAPPIIGKDHLGNTGRESAFSKRLPEI